MNLLNHKQCDYKGRYSPDCSLPLPAHDEILAYGKDGKTYHNLDAIDFKPNRNQHRCKMVNGELRLIEAPAHRQKKLEALGNF